MRPLAARAGFLKDIEVTVLAFLAVADSGAADVVAVVASNETGEVWVTELSNLQIDVTPTLVQLPPADPALAGK